MFNEIRGENGNDCLTIVIIIITDLFCSKRVLHTDDFVHTGTAVRIRWNEVYYIMVRLLTHCKWAFLRTRSCVWWWVRERFMVLMYIFRQDDRWVPKMDFSKYFTVYCMYNKKLRCSWGALLLSWRLREVWSRRRFYRFGADQTVVYTAVNNLKTVRVWT